MFKQNFLWGAASSAAQIEGAILEDGRSLSVWDNPPKKKIKYGENPTIACDHYHHYKEDVALMKKIGLKSYRFSISWSRICPKKDFINPKGLEFYRNLICELKNANIEPIITLFHWDMPLWVYKEGGFSSKKTLKYFEDYVSVIIKEFSLDVKYWITLNEPSVFITLGYCVGVHAPFKFAPLKTFNITKNVLRYHAIAFDTIKKYAKQDVKVGISLAVNGFVPKDNNEESINEARNVTFSNPAKSFDTNWWADATVLGAVNDKFINLFIGAKTIKENYRKLDFLGINVYRPLNYTCQKEYRMTPEQGTPKNNMGWELYPSVIYWTLKFFYEKYNIPMMVTENGMCSYDVKTNDNKVLDGTRIYYLEQIFNNLEKAINDGVDLIGYQYWSIMDNFEWAAGYDPRFGLIYIDYQTQERTLKESAKFYSNYINNH